MGEEDTPNSGSKAETGTKEAQSPVKHSFHFIHDILLELFLNLNFTLTKHHQQKPFDGARYLCVLLSHLTQVTLLRSMGGLVISLLIHYLYSTYFQKKKVHIGLL